MIRTHRSSVEWSGGCRGRRGAPRLALLTLLTLLTLLAAGARESAAQPYFLFPTLPGDRPLEFGNGTKVVVGPFNIQHAVYTSGGQIYYSRSADGAAWTPPVAISSSAASHPAIAVDSAGKVGVVWVHHAGFGNGYGDLYYSYRSSGSAPWISTPLGFFGAEPALVAGGGTMHVTWTEPGRIKYASFASASPFPNTPEIVDTTSCTAGGFRKPSLALVSSPSSLCPPSLVTIAYLTHGVSPGCTTSNVGPRVRRRSSPAAWTQLYSNIVGTESQIVSEPISLSFSANRITGDMFLAWSDKPSGTARTMLAKGVNTFWGTVQMSTTARHVHVRAASSLAAPATQFRLAWTAAGSTGDAFYGTASFVDTATWVDFVSPVWTGATLLSTLGAGRPQAVFWKRCVSGAPSSVLAETRAYFEATNSSGGGRSMATSYLTGPGCPVVTPGTATACASATIAIATLGLAGQTSGATVVDVGEVGVLTQLSPTSATVTTPDGRTATVSWRSGGIAASSETSLTLTAPRADVTVTSASVPFTLLELGLLGEDEGRSLR